MEINMEVPQKLRTTICSNYSISGAYIKLSMSAHNKDTGISTFSAPLFTIDKTQNYP
jgi:hypothetical protein